MREARPDRYVVLVHERSGLEDTGRFPALGAARACAKREVAGSRGASECGMPAWAFDLQSAYEAFCARDAGEEGRVAVISTLPIKWEK